MEPIFFLLLVAAATAMDNLKVVYQWKQLDFDFPSSRARDEVIRNREFIPENNLPLGLEVYEDRLFITVPRWKMGVAASLTYINLSDSTMSPKLKPYPNWEAHNLNSTPQIISPFRVRADRCDRLWVLDTGIEGLIDEHTKEHTSTRLLVYDLRDDSLLRNYPIQGGRVKHDSFFATLAVEDHDCEDSYAYLADLGKPAIVVYSWKRGDSWRIKHNYFHPDPMSGEFNVSDIVFEWDDGIFGLALSKPDRDGFSTLYFHPMASTDEFAVSTKYLRNESLAKSNFHDFKRLGSRGMKGQSGVSFLDQKTDVLFYALVNLNAVACWKTTNSKYTMESQGRIYMSKETMVFPNDIKVDSKDNLWVLSDKMPVFLYGKLNPDEINYRILMAPVADAIKGTSCDSNFTPVPDIVEKIIPRAGDKKDNSGSRIGGGFFFLVLVVAIRNL